MSHTEPNNANRWRRVFEILALVSSTQILVLPFAGLLGLGPRSTSALSLATLVVTLLIYYSDSIRLPWNRARPRLKPIVAFCLGGLSALLFLSISLAFRYAAEPRAELVSFYANFLTWMPKPDPNATPQIVRVPSPTDPKTLIPINVYQEAIYWTIYRIDWHLGGTFRNESWGEDGYTKEDVLLPLEAEKYTITYKQRPQEGGGMVPACVLVVPLRGVDTVVTVVHHYNCFSRDNWHYGFTLRLPAKRVKAVFDFSHVDKAQVFDLDYQPRIIVKREPYSTVKDVTETSRWEDGILYAVVNDLDAGAAVELDCKWKKSAVGSHP